MGYFDSLMQGETGGMPNGVQPTNLLGNPMLQIGLSLLANNNSKNFGQNIGRGGLQALQNIGQFQQQSQMNKFRDMQMKQAEEEAKRQEEELNLKKTIEQSKVDAFGRLSQVPQGQEPSFSDLYAVDPKAAINMRFPKAANQESSYFQAISTPQGLARFNARTGEMELINNAGGQPFVKSTDDPMLQGTIAERKARANAGYKINTDIPGQVMTDRQVAEMAGQSIPQGNFNTPYPMTWNGQAMGAEGTTQTDRAEGVRSPQDINVGNPARPNRGGGISIPTKAQQKAEEEMAITQAKNAMELPKVVEQGETTIKLVDDLINSKGFESAVGLSSKLDPRNYIAGTDATDFNIRLDQLKGQQFLQAFESLKGGGQITEVEGKKATDAISRMNTSASEKEFKKAANEFKDIIKSATERAKAKSGLKQIMPKGESMTKARSRDEILKQYGVK